MKQHRLAWLGLCGVASACAIQFDDFPLATDSGSQGGAGVGGQDAAAGGNGGALGGVGGGTGSGGGSGGGGGSGDSDGGGGTGATGGAGGTANGGSAGASGTGGSGGSATACAIAGGYGHTVVRRIDGTLWGWGLNNGGQASGDTAAGTSVLSATQVVTLGSSVAEVAVNSHQTCARKSDGTLWCWGGNEYGQVGNGTIQLQTSPVQVATLGSNVAQVAVGWNHTCARRTDGTLWCWGRNQMGQLGDGTTTGSDCSTPCKSTPIQVLALGSEVAQVAGGYNHTCALKQNGSVWCWGLNAFGQLGDGTTTGQSCAGGSACRPSPVQVAALGTAGAYIGAGHYHTCARKLDGTLWCWGWNVQGQLGIGVAPTTPTPAQVTALGTGVAEVGGGETHTCARKNDGTLWCWGNNQRGQLGDGTFGGSSYSPIQVIALGSAVAGFGAGAFHNCAHLTDATIWCWGRNNDGQLGDGTKAGVSCLGGLPCNPVPTLANFACQ